MSTFPHFEYEQSLWSQGVKNIIGIDEVGRGAFAGPVVVGAVRFNTSNYPNHLEFTRGIRDSKELPPKQRQRLAELIRAHAEWSIGLAPPEIIDRYGMTVALHQATTEALTRLAGPHVHILSDARLIKPSANFPHITEIKHGDSISISIAAASIVAKVWRDNHMERLGANWRYRVYRWSQNKGYGTATHRQAIRVYGPTIHHRLTFCHLQ